MEQRVICKHIADEAVAALIEEVRLTPKPGLVDMANNGAHHDLTLQKMQDSAHSLHNTFYQMAMLSFNQQPSVALREKFGAIGRMGEKEMFTVTDNVNTHKGAIWSIGLLCAAMARRKGQVAIPQVFDDAAELAQLPDQYIPPVNTNGSNVRKTYGIPGAREEAQQAFPHIRNYSLPAFHQAIQTMSLHEAKLFTLLVLIANLNDTCIVYRGGIEGLKFAKQEANKQLTNFSIANIQKLDEAFIKQWLSPGGAADLLAATLFVINMEDKLKRGVQHGKIDLYVSSGSSGN